MTRSTDLVDSPVRYAMGRNVSARDALEGEGESFKYSLNRGLGAVLPDLLREFAERLVDERMTQQLGIIADGVEMHISALQERLEFKESLVDRHHSKVEEARLAALTEAVGLAKAVATTRTPSVDSIDPKGHYVYVLWSNDEGPVYVGKTGNVLSRPGRHMYDLGRHDATDYVQLLSCVSAAEATQVEIDLIRLYRPRFNTMYKPK